MNLEQKGADISSDVSPIYVFPGICGEESELQEFQNKLLDRIPVEVVALQSLEEPFVDLVDMKAIGAAAAREINRRSPEGSLRLAGYSFGGSVAFEASQHLIVSGRSICFLGIIDGMVPRQLPQNVQAGSWGERPLRIIGSIYTEPIFARY